MGLRRKFSVGILAVGVRSLAVVEPASPPISPPNAGPPAEPDETSPAEPFGQAGVRQYVVPILHWVCVVLFAVSVTMWWRSGQIVDELSLRRLNQTVEIRSGIGQLSLRTELFQARRYGNNPWTYRSLPVGGRTRDRWEDGMWKRIGVQLTPGAEGGSAHAGFLLRVKWYFATTLCALLPVTRGVLRLWRRRRPTE
jgi:hypothetical protein